MGRKHRIPAACLAAIGLLLAGCATVKYDEFDFARNDRLLKSSGPYGADEAPSPPAFSYQRSNSPDLSRLRKDFQLDGVVGTGGETKRIIRLMRWVHARARHDGSGGNVDAWNAFDLLRLAGEEGRGLNCWKLSILLNEVYLSMGFKSRFVTCMPASEKFSDCHVVTEVYSSELGRWIMMDPTFEAYVVDEEGNILGLEGFRARLVDGSPVKLNAYANWNGRREPEYEYVRYMTKNLYRLEAPLSSTFDFEAPGRNRDYLQLVPVGYRKDLSPVSRTLSDGTSVRCHFTTDASRFWAEPDGAQRP